MHKEMMAAVDKANAARVKAIKSTLTALALGFFVAGVLSAIAVAGLDAKEMIIVPVGLVGLDVPIVVARLMLIGWND